MDEIQLKTKDDLQLLKASGKILVHTLREVKKHVRPGVSLLDLEKIAKREIEAQEAEPAFLGYKPKSTSEPYPAAICASVNETVVHGIPYDVELKEGDILKIDIGVKYKNRFTDAAITMGVGKTPKEAKKLLKTTNEALKRAIKVCKPGKYTGDIGWVIENTIKKQGFEIVEKLTGHGVGFDVHEPPTVRNNGEKGSGEELVPGMVIAIEPMVAMGSGEVFAKEDGSFVVKDNSLTAHFEKTIAITERGPLDLTPW
jgi:methionyl aminopeptidase